MKRDDDKVISHVFLDVIQIRGIVEHAWLPTNSVVDQRRKLSEEKETHQRYYHRIDCRRYMKT